MNSRQIIKQLEFKHPIKPGLVTVKHPDGDIPAGTLNSIQKQAGWKK
jgi:predicted RNA binding protein YcfA (HicA-like mRNA interferase family)